MRLSAIILSFNSSRTLEVCLRSLAAALGEDDEIWVVENGSTDGSVAILRRLEAELPALIRAIYCPVNTGTTVSRNMALRRATGRLLLVMDSDVTVPAGLLPVLIQRVEADGGIGILAPQLVYGHGGPQLSTDRFPTIGRKLTRLFRLKAMERRLPPEGEIDRDVDYAISAFWLLRRDVLERVGLFDENIFYSPEDVDYCLRVWLAGYRVVFTPVVTAIHDAQEVSRRLSIFALRHAAGLIYYFAKHRYAFSLGRLYRRLGVAAGGGAMSVPSRQANNPVTGRSGEA